MEIDPEQTKDLATDINNMAAASYLSGYEKGYEDGLRTYAWWKDGVQYVGSCGTTLKKALEEGSRE